MYFLLSGEGITDMGIGRTNESICEADNYIVGPMAIVAAKIVEAQHSYSFLEGACGFVSERSLALRAKELKATKKELRLPGKKTPKETRYFYNNARSLSRIAKDKSDDISDEVVAILFRDSDGTASAGRGLWEQKRQSILDGFAEEEFEAGVPMIPQPKSEAWLICAFKKLPYQGCDELEGRSGNDNSPNPLKEELDALLGEKTTPKSLCDKVADDFAIDRIKMPSFRAFRQRLEAVI